MENTKSLQATCFRYPFLTRIFGGASYYYIFHVKWVLFKYAQINGLVKKTTMKLGIQFRLLIKHGHWTFDSHSFIFSMLFFHLLNKLLLQMNNNIFFMLKFWNRFQVKLVESTKSRLIKPYWFYAELSKIIFDYYSGTMITLITLDYSSDSGTTTQ